MNNRYKPYIYRVENKQGNLEDYSGYFYTKEQALKWYEKEGRWLEKNLNRTLILVKNSKQINLFTNIEDYVSSTLFN